MRQLQQIACSRAVRSSRLCGRAVGFSETPVQRRQTYDHSQSPNLFGANTGIDPQEKVDGTGPIRSLLSLPSP